MPEEKLFHQIYKKHPGFDIGLHNFHLNHR